MEKIYQIALTHVEGIGSVFFRQLLTHFGSAENVFKAKTDQLLKISGIRRSIIESLHKKQLLVEAEKILKTAEKEKITLFFSTDKDYPSRLKNIYDAPAILYYKGNANLNHSKSVSLVGTRQAGEYGKRVTEQIVHELKEINPLIISGLAFGIDIYAHRAALENHLATIAVFANGLDITYPSQHAKYIQAILENGGIISENALGTQPFRNLFLARNRIIAALSDVCIVVESAAKGGAMVTAEFANNYHREDFAVPGQIYHKYSEGCNHLIKNNKANIFTSTAELVELMHWKEGHSKPIFNKNTLDLSLFTEDESQIISILRMEGDKHIDELGWQMQISLNKLASLLLNLEFQGIIRALPGKKFGLK